MNKTTVSPDVRRTRLVWSLLAAWLIYSGSMLGHALANDPLLATYVCMTR
ncbi:MAG: hypothetical protein ACOZB0_02550 [Pseudomonadota bacterium]